MIGALITMAAVLTAVLITAAWTIWLERRLLALWQDRLGPNRVGPFGLLQVVADMIKIFTKDDWTPPFAERGVFILAPSIVVASALLAFAVVPFAPGVAIVELNVGLLFFLAATALAAYSSVLAGWSSNNKYALLGGLRSSAQVLSYEVFMALSLLGVVMLAGSFDLREIVEAQRGLWFCVPQVIGLLLFLIAGSVESHRLPFDLPMAESELISGYHTEYSGLKFGLFYVGEYISLLLISLVTVILFFGGWLGPWLPPLAWLVIKTFLLLCFFILLRAALPRPRYDQLMRFGWLWLLPLSLLNLAATGAVVLWREG